MTACHHLMEGQASVDDEIGVVWHVWSEMPVGKKMPGDKGLNQCEPSNPLGASILRRCGHGSRREIKTSNFHLFSLK